MIQRTALAKYRWSASASAQSTAASFVLFVRREFKLDIYCFVVDSLDKQIQNEKELIRLASAVGWGGYFVFVWRV